MKQKTKQKVITEREIIRFRQCLYKAEKSPSTIDKYVRDVRKLQQYADGRILTKTLMLEYKRDLEVSSTYKATSINSYIAAINQFCQAMHRRLPILTDIPGMTQNGWRSRKRRIVIISRWQFMKCIWVHGERIIPEERTDFLITKP